MHAYVDQSIRPARGPHARARRDRASRTDLIHPQALLAPPSVTGADHRVGRTGHRMQKNTLSHWVPEQRSDGPKCSLESQVAILYYRKYYRLYVSGLRVCSDEHTLRDRRHPDEPARHRDGDACAEMHACGAMLV